MSIYRRIPGPNMIKSDMYPTSFKSAMKRRLGRTNPNGDLEGLDKCMKRFMYMANFIIMLGGLIVFSLGLWTVTAKAFVKDLLGTDLYMSSAYVMITTGLLAVLISFMGCYAAIREKKSLLTLYVVFLYMLFVTLLIGGMLGYVFRNCVQKSIEREMQESMKMYSTDQSITAAWDDTQAEYKCCGINKFEDWLTTFTNGKVPPSCCLPTDKENKCVNSPNRENTHQDGCFVMALDDMKAHALIIGISATVVAFLMILGIITAVALFIMLD